MAKFKQYLLKTLQEEQAITLDPNGDMYEAIESVMTYIVKSAYEEMVYDRKKHEQKYGPRSDDEDAYNFEFTEAALEDRIDSFVVAFKDCLTEKSNSFQQTRDYISSLSHTFAEPLEK